MKRRHALGAAGTLAAVLALTSYASPYWTLHRMNTAIAEKDAERFSSYVDFPALRASVKGQVLAAMNQRLSSRGLEDSPFAGIGKMMGAALINPIVDAAVSPAGVMAMFESGRLRPLPGPPAENPPQEQARTQSESADYAVAYQTWSRVAIYQPGSDTGRFILNRTGLWSWQLAALEFPTSAIDSAR